MTSTEYALLCYPLLDLFPCIPPTKIKIILSIAPLRSAFPPIKLKESLRLHQLPTHKIEKRLHPTTPAKKMK